MKVETTAKQNAGRIFLICFLVCHLALACKLSNLFSGFILMTLQSHLCERNRTVGEIIEMSKALITMQGVQIKLLTISGSARVNCPIRRCWSVSPSRQCLGAQLFAHWNVDAWLDFQHWSLKTETFSPGKCRYPNVLSLFVGRDTLQQTLAECYSSGFIWLAGSYRHKLQCAFTTIYTSIMQMAMFRHQF